MSNYSYALFLLVLFLQESHAHRYRCIFHPGDGAGGDEIKIGDLKGRQCIDACLEKKKNDSSINGVTTRADNTGGCYCEKQMERRDSNPTWQSCFLVDTERKVDYRCVFGLGDGRGADEILIGKQKGLKCIDACLKRKRNDSSINGVTTRADNKGGCYCEKQMDGRDNSAYWKSCFIGDAELNLGYKCVLRPGDGLSLGEIRIENKKGRQCLAACLERKKNDSSINGMTVRADHKEGCYCEKQMDGRDNSAYWKSCFIEETVDIHDRCIYGLGDGVGGEEIKIGNQIGRQCINACIEMKKHDSSINGVSTRVDNTGECWCEKKMKKRDDNPLWKSCFITEN